MVRTWAAIAILSLASTASAAEVPSLPEGGVLLDGDMVWEMSEPNCFALSPDDKLIAYISRGALWICDVTSGPPKKLADLPDTLTALLNTPEYRVQRADFNWLGSKVNSIALSGKLKHKALAVAGLDSAPSQDGVVYAMRDRWQEQRQIWPFQVRHASTEGLITTLAAIQRNSSEQPQLLTMFNLTRNRKALVISDGYTALIWDTATNKPRATCFDYLLPSSTSERFLGVEIDTRQLVEADEDFKIINRFDAALVSQQQCDMVWSADRRFAICRQPMEYPSQKWAGFRINLATGEKRELTSSYLREQFAFTGRDGEVVPNRNERR